MVKPTQGLAAKLATGEDRMLRVREVQAMLGMSRQSVYRLFGATGQLIRVGPKRLGIRVSAVQAYLDKLNRVPA